MVKEQTFFPHGNREWLTPAEAAAYTGHHRSSLRKWAANGLIACKENPRHHRTDARRRAWLYKKKDIDKNILNIN